MSDTAETEVAVEEPREPCLCGCGLIPKHKRSRFMPGHDAQMKAQLYRVIRDENAPEHEKDEARATLDKFEWPMPAPKKVRAAKPQVDVAEGSEVTSADL